jgi:hypothetical protein
MANVLQPFGGPEIEVIAHVIQLAVAPVFLLTGVAGLLGVMANRLSRVIDRGRALEALWPGLDESGRQAAQIELANLGRRGRLASWAINFCTTAALFVCAVVATLFLDAVFPGDLKWLVAVFFIASMLLLIGGLVCFLREVYLATHTLRIGPPPR